VGAIALGVLVKMQYCSCHKIYASYSTLQSGTARTHVRRCAGAHTRAFPYTFVTLLYGLELLGDSWESGTHVIIIEKLNQRNTTHPKAQSIYQRRGGHLGGAFGSVGRKVLSRPIPSPEATVKY
jgi:hypothetical protein